VGSQPTVNGSGITVTPRCGVLLVARVDSWQTFVLHFESCPLQFAGELHPYGGIGTLEFLGALSPFESRGEAREVYIQSMDSGCATVHKDNYAVSQKTGAMVCDG
jgi:hypothetical protein